MPDVPEPRWPSPTPDPAPINIDLYMRFTPEKLELIEGYLIDGPESPEARLKLLALLLTNAGLKAALRLASRQAWEQAMREVFG